MNPMHNPMATEGRAASRLNNRRAWTPAQGGIHSCRRKRLALLAIAIAGLGLVSAGRVAAQTFTTIKSFGILSKVSGLNPQSTLVQGPDGTLYGTTRRG